MLTDKQIDTIAEHVLIAALWADCPEGTHPKATRQAKTAARQFVVNALALIPPSLVQEALTAEGYGSHHDAGSPEAAFGHDLYLTARGHGVGFLDREELGILSHATGTTSVGYALDDIVNSNNYGVLYIETEFYRGWIYLRGRGTEKKE